jgi:F-type H+-transporting ATPase subunit delta
MTDPKALAEAASAATVFDSASPELARTYSEAILNVAEKTGGVEEILEELEAIRDEVIGKFPTFAMMMGSPLRNPAEKDRLIVSLFEGKADPTVVKFLRVLNRHGRLELLGSIIRAARSAWNQRQNRTSVIVRSAVPLESDQADAIRDRLAKAFRTTPVLKLEVDPKLIGGLVVQIGDDVFDASVSTRLQRLRQGLIEGITHEIQSRRDYFSSSE